MLSIYPVSRQIYGALGAGTQSRLVIRTLPRMRALTPSSEHHMMLTAAIRAQPPETPPQPGSCERQRGAHSRIGFVCPLRHHGALLGSVPWCIQRRIDDATQQGSQAPGSHSHEKDGRSL